MPDDPKQIWQNQPTEVSRMIVEKMIERRAGDLHAKTRRELIKLIAVLLFTVAFSAFGIIRGTSPAQRLTFGLAVVWALAAQYAVNRGMWSQAVPGASGLATGLEFYRSAIEQRRSLLGRFWGWTFGPLILAMAAFIVPLAASAIPRGMLPKMLPFLVLLVLWFGGVLIFRHRTQNDLQREMDELDEIEKERF